LRIELDTPSTFTRRLNGVERTFAVDDVFFHRQQ
jgi:hypothetical protein